ncbi:MAG: NAD(P)/FAD-dependent oxidoreductase [Pirellulaceae bacterium]
MISSDNVLDVVIVGGGAAGVGVAAALKHAGLTEVAILERHVVGGSFQRWPAEMRLITPSFPTNSIGMLDLNSVAIGTSPAYTLQVEHPTGKQYATYLQAVARFFKLKVNAGIDVFDIEPDTLGFTLHTSQGEMRARHVIWAAGEFQYPRTGCFPGSELCRHNSQVRAWSDTSGKEALVLGGYESGMDAALHMAERGIQVTVLDRGSAWSAESSDPSISLSTYTHERYEKAKHTGNIRLVPNAEVVRVEQVGTEYEAITTDQGSFRTTQPPILATGFHGSHKLIQNLFEQREDGYPLLSEEDESTITPGLFLVGPSVRHDQHVFCFIYKFRQRFAVVAKTIAERVGADASQLEMYRQWGMFLDDLSCCGEECVC